MNYIDEAHKRNIIPNGYVPQTKKEADMVSAETVSRIQAEKVLLSINPSLIIKNTDQTHIYDLHFASGTTTVIVEAKARTVKSTEFDTVKLSAAKYDRLLKAKKDHQWNGEIWFLSSYTDGVAYIFDMVNTPAKRGVWEHRRTTAARSPEIIKEEYVEFSPSNAKFTVNYDA